MPRHTRTTWVFALLVTGLLCNALGVGQSAVLTLLFPPGARATGLGEAFVAMSDDANATYFNPAGLGLAPLSNSWQAFLAEESNKGWVAVAGRQELTFAARPTVWAATPHTLWRFDGKGWFDYESYLLEQNDNVRRVVERYVDDEDLWDVAQEEVRSFNEIDEETLEETLVELKLPFMVGANGHITCLTIDPSDRLWVGTQTGLRKYDGVTWHAYSTLDGLVGNEITALCAHGNLVWIGTTQGLSRYDEGDWETYTVEKGDLPGKRVTALAVSGSIAWVGTDSGLVRIEGEDRTVYTEKDGLISNQVVDVGVDKEGVVWVAHAGGVTSYTKKKWKRFRFPKARVSSMVIDENNMVWVGSEKGILRYDRGKPKINEKGETVYPHSEWKHLHSRNALAGNQIKALGTQGRDVWVATNEAINRYDKADRQVLFAHEQLLPLFGFEDLYHDFFAMTWPTEEWGTLGYFINFISFGEIEHTSESGVTLGTFYSWELVASLCYGTELKKDMSVGLNAKYAYSPLADLKVGNQTQGIGQTFAIDAAFLKRNLLPKFDVGVHLQNMGPPIFYTDRSQSDPIPLNIKAGFAVRPVSNPIHEISILFDANRELVKPNDIGLPDPWYKAVYTSLNDESWEAELEQVILNTGMEYWYSHFVAGRIGFLYDPDGSRREFTFGVGVEYGNLNIDWSYIAQPFEDASPAREGQMRFSVLFLF